MALPTKDDTRATGQASHNRKRSDRGLTTLEWLLIVAAVAGLAALAVVLVQNVVDDTAEQISQGSARLTAAKVAAQAITDDAADLTITVGKATEDPVADADKTQASKRNDLKARCERLRITYGNEIDTDAEVWKDSDDTSKAKCEVKEQS